MYWRYQFIMHNFNGDMSGRTSTNQPGLKLHAKNLINSKKYPLIYSRAKNHFKTELDAHKAFLELTK
jgi:hypothetical protein